MGLLDRIGLNRPETRAWAMYDFANSAFVTTVITAVFPPFYQAIAEPDLPDAVATTRFAWATTAALVVVALMSPVLGAIADQRPIKKKMLAAFMALGVTATAAMPLIGAGDWLFALVLFALGNIGVATSFVFYDALLPHIARTPDELDRVSTAGYALGYLGGGVLLAVNLVMILKPELLGLADSGAGTRVALASVAVWWVVFSIPLFRRVAEPPVAVAATVARAPMRTVVRHAFRDLRRTLTQLRRYRNAYLMLGAFLIYNDGIATIIRMATIFGREVGLDMGTMIAVILMVQFVGIPFSFLFGQIAGRIGARPAIFIGIAIYAVVSVLAFRMTTATEFWILGGLVAMVQGGTQALSRSLFASMIPRAKSSEFFGLFAVFEKFAGIFGPLLFGLAVSLTDSSRTAILTIGSFFVLGALLLSRVDVGEGRRIAAEADAAAAAEAAADAGAAYS